MTGKFTRTFLHTFIDITICCYDKKNFAKGIAQALYYCSIF